MAGNWERRLRIVQTMAAIVGILAVGIGYLDYRRKAELQALRGLHEAQLSTCKAVANAAAGLYEATNQHEFDLALSAFAKLKHGEALAILDPPVLTAMLTTWGEVAKFRSGKQGADFQTEARYKLCDDPLKVVLACRTMLASGFRIEGGEAIKLLDDNFTMQWMGCHH